MRTYKCPRCKGEIEDLPNDDLLECNNCPMLYYTGRDGLPRGYAICLGKYRVDWYIGEGTTRLNFKTDMYVPFIELKKLLPYDIDEKSIEMYFTFQ